MYESIHFQIENFIKSSKFIFNVCNFYFPVSHFVVDSFLLIFIVKLISTDLNWDLEDSFTAVKQDQVEMQVWGDDLLAKKSF